MSRDLFMNAFTFLPSGTTWTERTNGLVVMGTEGKWTGYSGAQRLVSRDPAVGPGHGGLKRKWGFALASCFCISGFVCPR